VCKDPADIRLEGGGFLDLFFYERGNCGNDKNI